MTITPENKQLVFKQNETLLCRSEAVFSACMKYRYLLTRTWDDNAKSITYLMLNPSTADEMVNDPTIERCQRRAVEYGFGRMVIANILPFRMTDSTQLHTVEDLLGEDDFADEAIIHAVGISEITVCGWGNHHFAKGRSEYVLNILESDGLTHKLHALEVNKNGSPKHPLYVGYDKKPIRLIGD